MRQIDDDENAASLLFWWFKRPRQVIVDEASLGNWP